LDKTKVFSVTMVAAVSEPPTHRGLDSLDRERRAELRGQHAVRDQEQHQRDNQPGDGLRTRLGGLGDTVQAYDCAGGEQHQIEPAKDPP
jgi:hypothetical protein